jgi:hypothetical protein
MLTNRVTALVALLCAACGTSVQPSDAALAADVASADAVSGADVEIVEPTSLVRVVHIPAFGTQPARTEAWAWLSLPDSASPGAIDRDLGDCYHRRPAASSPRFYTDGTASWGYQSVRRPMTLVEATGPFFGSARDAQPAAGDVVDVSLRGSTFPDFALRAELPGELTVSSHASGSSIPYPRRGEPFVIEWVVPAAPASVRITIHWNDSDSLYCVVPATRGRFVMEEPLLDMFRDATTAQLVVSHAQVQRVVVGNRSLRYIVERRGVLATFER